MLAKRGVRERNKKLQEHHGNPSTLARVCSHFAGRGFTKPETVLGPGLKESLEGQINQVHMPSALFWLSEWNWALFYHL